MRPKIKVSVSVSTSKSWSRPSLVPSTHHLVTLLPHHLVTLSPTRHLITSSPTHLTPCSPCEPAASSRPPGGRRKKRGVKKPTMQIGATTIIPLSGREDSGIRYQVEEDSDRDEAEASDSDMEDEEAEERKEEEEEAAAKPPAVRRPCILIFDSLKGGSKARTCQTLRDYLGCEWRAKMEPAGDEERAFDNSCMPGSQPTVQQQPNFSDCGIYLLQYIESFFRDPIPDYNFPIKEAAGKAMAKAWFSKDEVRNFF